MTDYHELMQRLWDDYRALNPQADAIHRLLTSRGEAIVNDHIAFRTFADERVSIDVLARPFVAAGFQPRGEYHFPTKHLYARHFEHPQGDQPRIFISELKLEEFSPELRETVLALLDQIPPQELSRDDLCVRGRLWSLDRATYQRLADESEYAGWMGAFGFRANHFTVLVNALRTVSSLRELNDLLKQAGYELNAHGGEIKGTPEVCLEQSSTLAAKVETEFADGSLEVPGCYYEFAQRHPLPDGSLFSGFIAESADKIFQSTDRRD